MNPIQALIDAAERDKQKDPRPPGRPWPREQGEEEGVMELFGPFEQFVQIACAGPSGVDAGDLVSKSDKARLADAGLVTPKYGTGFRLTLDGERVWKELRQVIGYTDPWMVKEDPNERNPIETKFETIGFDQAQKGDWLVNRGGDVRIKINSIGWGHPKPITVTLAGCYEGNNSQAWGDLGFHVEREEKGRPKASRFDIPASEDTFVWKRGGSEGDYIDVPFLLDLLSQAEAERERLEAALKECRACIEDGKPSHALDVIDKLFPHTGPKEQK